MHTFITFYVYNHIYLYQSTSSSQSEISVSWSVSHTHFKKLRVLHCTVKLSKTDLILTKARLDL